MLLNRKNFFLSTFWFWSSHKPRHFGMYSSLTLTTANYFTFNIAGITNYGQATFIFRLFRVLGQFTFMRRRWSDGRVDKGFIKLVKLPRPT